MTLPRWIGPGALAFVAIWLVLLGAGRSRLLADPGTFWHVTTGDLILAGGFLRADPYTFTFGGTWWVPYQWLGEVAMALGHRAGGFDVVVLGAVTVLAGTFAWLFARLVRTGLTPAAAGAAVALGCAAAAAHFHTRPHVVTMLMMGVTAAALAAADAGRVPVRRLLWLAPAFAVWANVHGGVIGGVATVGLAAAGWAGCRAVGLPSPVRGWRDALLAAALAAACAAAVFVNPYGLDLLRTWHVIMGEPALRLIIQEHSGMAWGETYAVAAILFGALYLVVLAGLPAREFRASWLLPVVWFAMGVDRVRHVPLFVVVTLAVLPDVWPRTRWAARLARSRPDVYDPAAVGPPRHWLASIWLPAAVVLAAFGLQAGRVPVPVAGAGWVRHDPAKWPVDVLDVLKAHEPGPGGPNKLFNDYVDGGFVIYHAPGYKVFVDDRCEVFGGAWLVDFVVAGGSDTTAAMARWQAAYGRFDYALTRTGTGFDAYFRTAPGWRLVKETTTATFYVRER